MQINVENNVIMNYNYYMTCVHGRPRANN